MNINLHIERLVLDGLPLEHRQGPHLQAAIEQELGRLLSQAEAPARLGAGRHATRVDAGTIQVAERADPAGVGRQIAAAVYRGVGGRP